MEILICIALTLAVIFAFVSGVYVGSHWITGKKAGIKGETEAAREDPERQRRFEEDLKAFEACMNYSMETAYGQGKEQ